jgi:transcriptional antiterminator NusG
MSEGAKWYAIHTYSGYENKVAQNIEKVAENSGLLDLIKEVRVPVEKITEITGSKTKETERKIFPGYVLLKMIITDESWYVVRNTRGVTGFVGPGSEPTPLTEKEVNALSIEPENPQIQISYSVGDCVRIIGTAMDGLEAEVKKIDIPGNTVDVVISMFGRETPATLALNQVMRVV